MTKHKAHVIGAPVFPSLYKEGKKGGGYDVKIPVQGTPVFLQFKLSDCLKRKSAKEHQKLSLKLPYYRMHLRPLRHSQQHQLLLDLENLGQLVYYVAPEFHLPRELNRHYLSRSVVKNSAAFAPSSIGALPDNGDHYVVFEKGSTYGYRCSEAAKRVGRANLAAVLEVLRSKERSFGPEGLSGLTGRMVELIRKRAVAADLPRSAASEAQAIAQERSAVESAGYLARAYFASELIVVGTNTATD